MTINCIRCGKWAGRPNTFCHVCGMLILPPQVRSEIVVNAKSVQCDKEVQIDLNSTMWYRCDLECPDGKKHDGLCQTTIYNAKWHDGRNVRRKNIVIQWSVKELSDVEPEETFPEVPQCDFRAPARWLHAEDTADMIICEEPAYFNCRVLNNTTRAVITFQRCTQHGEQLRNYIRDNDGLTRSGKVRILSVEEIKT